MENFDYVSLQLKYDALKDMYNSLKSENETLREEKMELENIVTNLDDNVSELEYELAVLEVDEYENSITRFLDNDGYLNSNKDLMEELFKPNDVCGVDVNKLLEVIRDYNLVKNPKLVGKLTLENEELKSLLFELEVRNQYLENKFLDS